MPAKPAAPKPGTKEHAQEVFATLERRYPDPAPALDYASPWELLVATVLAAQCTDARVNQVTPVLFARWPGIADLAAAEVADIEDVVRSTGFFRNKARNLKAAAARVMEVYGGEVPRTMADLTSLPGVARKTANVVLGNAFGINEGIAVDTHVTRIAYRLGLTNSDDPKVIERDMMPLFERSQWSDINHFLVYFGREVCDARKPKCPACELAGLCPRKGLQ